MMLAQVPISLGSAQGPLNLDSDIKTVEIAYTWYWIDKVVRPEWSDAVNREEAECLSNVGAKGDDAVVVSWDAKGFRFDVVDTRFLVLVVRKQEGKKETVLDMFKKFIAFDHQCNKKTVTVRSELTGNEGNQVSWGKMIVDRGNAAGWFDVPIEWCQTETALVLVFDKSLRPPVSKVPPRDASLLFGGASAVDTTPYFRFEKSNRREYAESRLQKKLIRSDLQKDTNGKTKGLPYRKATE